MSIVATKRTALLTNITTLEIESSCLATRREYSSASGPLTSQGQNIVTDGLRRMAYMKKLHSSCDGCHCQVVVSTMFTQPLTAYVRAVPYSMLSVIVCAAESSIFTDLIAPGSTITSAAAMVCAIGNVVESTTLTDPPESDVRGTLENSKPNACDACPLGLWTAVALSDGGSGETGQPIEGRSYGIHTTRENVQLFARDIVEG